jgi:hypothetical protein
MTIELNQEQLAQALDVMRAYLRAPSSIEGKSLIEYQSELDSQRVSVIENELQPVISSYLNNELALTEFKTKVDSINKRRELWGFSGIKGQMFFNMILKVADDLVECSNQISAGIRLPASEILAASTINNFAVYVRRIGDQHVESGGVKQGRPNTSSVPFYLSYFWQVLDRTVWPVYYTNSVSVMTDLNLWQPTGDLAADYIAYKHLQELLIKVFTLESGRNFTLYDVEHVFWFKGGKAFQNAKSESKSCLIKQGEEPSTSASPIGSLTAARLPDSYVPPIVAILPEMARNESYLQEAAKSSGTNIDRAFERCVDAAFTILGYETKLLGQGKGRVPDGLALSVDDSYAILWDAKVRGDRYGMGTDDRAIKEYIVTQSRDLKRRRGLRNIYYFIISSGFADDYDDAIRSIKMDTDVNEVCLVEAEALVAMVDAKLRFPQDVSLGPEGLQRLFSSSGIVSGESIRNTFL